MKKKGFTFAELLLCIGIIGIISAMGMTIAKRGTEKAYNLYYYYGYINLYDAIADAIAKEEDVNVSFAEDTDPIVLASISDNNLLNHLHEVFSDGANGAEITTQNGIKYVVDGSIDIGKPYTVFIMQVPVAKKRKIEDTNKVAFAYISPKIANYYGIKQDGLLLPITHNDAKGPNLQERRDLLPAYIDTGVTGRVQNRPQSGSSGVANDLSHNLVYRSYKDALCIVNGANIVIDTTTLLTCDMSQLPTSHDPGVVKVADPRKAR